MLSESQGEFVEEIFTNLGFQGSFFGTFGHFYEGEFSVAPATPLSLGPTAIFLSIFGHFCHFSTLSDESH